MSNLRAAAGSGVFFLLAPCVVAGLVPWWLTRWQVRSPLPFWNPLRVVGAVLVLAGAAFLMHAFARFVTEGSGTPAPIAPTERLVVGGVYRYVRNPMYLSVVTVIVGQAFVLRQLGLLVYALAVGLAMAAFVRLYEEPTLRGRYGAEYDEYRRQVRGWWPRLQNPYRNRT
jgi:protein-S-isoprenylcysteine O-methyltransferase Ste14